MNEGEGGKGGVAPRERRPAFSALDSRRRFCTLVSSLGAFLEVFLLRKFTCPKPSPWSSDWPAACGESHPPQRQPACAAG